jgi:ABC-type transporter Mla maintaining outer membrane lipid asymmetry ATPase subunit MlaF
MKAVELADVRVELEGQDRQAELVLSVESGEFVLLVGPNRSGKSLILKLCTGLVEPEQGTVRVLDQDLADLGEEGLVELRLHIGVVMQQPGLLSNMTVFNNVALPLRYHRGMDGEGLEASVMAQLEALGLASLRDCFPAQLNQGEARCAAIARALIMEPELLLLDDVTGGMDADMTRRLGHVLVACRQTRAVAVLATQRNTSPFFAMADRVAFVREGRIEAVGRPAEMLAIADGSMKEYLQ